MSGTDIDYDGLAAGFDEILPLLAPVTDGLAARAPGLVTGAAVLDVACGTGEPGLTLAERHGGLRLLGVDASERMIAIARAKAARRGLFGVRHEVMNAQKLDVEDRSVDVVVSRFGLLSFADPEAEAREVERVLRPGGSVAVATWDAPEANTITHALMAAAEASLPAPVKAVAEQQARYAEPGLRESWLRGAGLVDVTSETFGWNADFRDEAALWSLASGPAMLGAFSTNIDDAIRDAFRAAMAEHRGADGSYTIPYACRLIFARKNSHLNI
ncbi:class I SAM-dependent methyltransferase [Actinoplanes sp. NBRC 103695]|uniref:class I SAM-dependent methyltransferase n=1 Tax=Actinoplanes sp. NBRC 103695 TaxID=3032202 RepID=UPI0024A45723|nr:class I SAM-dependent methyltransferase [Actinoplanes sp. NBRC 103695]GLY93812.1 hypothetical protein Acsp02_10680 [Actinoplanes sp. NBRC 103695]